MSGLNGSSTDIVRFDSEAFGGTDAAKNFKRGLIAIKVAEIFGSLVQECVGLKVTEKPLILFSQDALHKLRSSGLFKMTTGANQDYTVVEVSDAGLINGNHMLRMSLVKLHVQSKRNAGNRPIFVVLFNFWPIKVNGAEIENYIDLSQYIKTFERKFKAQFDAFKQDLTTQYQDIIVNASVLFRSIVTVLLQIDIAKGATKGLIDI